MISSIELHNFGKHKHLLLELTPGINVVVGKSGVGKSWATIRALRWVALNRPLGERFRHWKSQNKDVRVGVTVDGSTNVIRAKRSDGDNVYIVDSKGLAEPHQEFRGFGSGVPDEVKEVLNLNDLNFQAQHEPLYLLSKSPTDVAKLLNDLAGLDDIGEAFQRIGKHLYSCRQRSTSAAAYYGNLRDQLEGYKDLPQLEKASSLANTLSDQIQKTRRRQRAAQNIAARFQPLSIQAGLYSRLPQIQMDEQQAEQLANAMSIAKANYNVMTRTATQWEQAQNRLGALEQLTKLKVQVTKAEMLSKKLGGTEARIEEMSRLIQTLANLSEIAYRVRSELDKKRSELEKAMPAECPLCGSQLKGRKDRKP